MSYSTNTIRLSALVAVTALAACSSSDSMVNGRSAVTLSFTPQGSTASADLLPTGVPASAVPITNNGHTLDLTSAALNISKVELHTAGKGEMETECDDGHGCGAIASTPLVVTLSPTGAVVTVATAIVPAGTYREIGVKVSSVRLVGTYDTRAFDIVVPVNVEREMEFKPPVTVGGSTDAARNITIAVPLTTWLTNADGTLIDPAKLATDASLRASVAARIRASLRAFRDDNHNSRDDDNDEHEGSR